MDLLVFFAAGLILVVYGVYKHARIEDNDYKKLVDAVKNYNVEVADFKKSVATMEEKLTASTKQVEELKTKVDALTKDNEQAQEHMARLRQGQIQLRDRSFPRTVDFNLKTPTAIPIEIHMPSKPRAVKAPEQKPAQKADPKLMKKLKKDLDKLSQ